MSTSIGDFTLNSIQGTPVSFADFKGKVILVVNTASGCGFTPQYKGLQALYDTYGPDNFVVLGFPCNQFGQQESASESEIQSFCELNFSVSFPLFEKIEVNGENAHPLYRYLKSSAKGILGSEGIKWNFTKFLIDANGNVIERYAPTTKPEAIAKTIEKLLL
ncbi:MAG: glutathione peroxidase [Shewanella sp.]|jgi:glutathione peroxidase